MENPFWVRNELGGVPGGKDQRLGPADVASRRDGGCFWRRDAPENEAELQPQLRVASRSLAGPNLLDQAKNAPPGPSAESHASHQGIACPLTCAGMLKQKRVGACTESTGAASR